MGLRIREMKEDSPRAALYVRSEGRAGGAERELERLRKWSRAAGWTIVEEYTDYATPLGSSRDDLDRLFRDARGGRFEVVVFTTLANFLPFGIRDTVQRLVALDRLDIGCVALDQPELSTFGEKGQRLRQALAILEGQEQRRISTRVRSGMVRAKREGRHVGRPKLSLEKRRKIVQLRRGGRTVAETAQAVGVSESTVVKYQHRPVDDLLELVVRAPTAEGR